MRTITVEIINDQAERVLEELERRNWIRIRNKTEMPHSRIDWGKKYKGTMTREPIETIENQLNELRNEWD